MQARLSLHMSKCHIVGNLMHWLNFVSFYSVCPNTDSMTAVEVNVTIDGELQTDDAIFSNSSGDFQYIFDTVELTFSDLEEVTSLQFYALSADESEIINANVSFFADGVQIVSFSFFVCEWTGLVKCMRMSYMKTWRNKIQFLCFQLWKYCGSILLSFFLPSVQPPHF